MTSAVFRPARPVRSAGGRGRETPIRNRLVDRRRDLLVLPRGRRGVHGAGSDRADDGGLAAGASEGAALDGGCGATAGVGLYVLRVQPRRAASRLPPAPNAAGAR